MMLNEVDGPAEEHGSDWRHSLKHTMSVRALS